MSLQELYEKYHDHVQFLSIYIREAHPIDGWWLGKGVTGLALKLAIPKAATDVHDPKSLDERRTVAGRCESTLAYGIPTLVDDMDDSVCRSYAAWPTRLYLVGSDGLVAYAGGPGPFGFKPKALGKAIEAYLSSSKPA